MNMFSSLMMIPLIFGFFRYRMTPLMYAAREGRVAVCEKLLEHGAEINKQDIRGWTVSFLLAIFLFQLKVQLTC